MAMTNIDIARVVELVLEEIARRSQDDLVPVNVSNRHVHLTEDDYRILFGDMPFLNVKDLLQTGQYASNRAVDVEGPKGTIKRVRILGPFRPETQVELAQTDARVTGIPAPVRMSGEIKGSAPVTLVGPKGQLELREGAIVAQRHIHMTPEDARRFGVVDGEKVDVRLEGPRPTTFNDTIIRVRDDFVLEMHLDTDEANALGATTGQLYGRVIRHDE